jgi:bifunctional non-homologous end joining protein LigD
MPSAADRGAPAYLPAWQRYTRAEPARRRQPAQAGALPPRAKGHTGAGPNPVAPLSGKGVAETIEVGGRLVEITHPDKAFFPGRPPITKQQLVAYYLDVAPVMLPYMRGRPVTLQRFPDGIGGAGFFQKEVSDWYPRWIHRATVPKEGGTVTHVLVEDAATLAYIAAQGCITPHVWLSRINKPRHPDRLIFDLDPPKTFEQARTAARLLHDLLSQLGLACFVMTTGSRGLHVLVPLDGMAEFAKVRAFAQSVAAVLAERHPDALTTEARIAKRGQRLYLDTTRNAYAQTAVSPYAVRAKPGAPVATPLRWAELDDPQLDSRSYSLRTVLDRLAREGDPLSGIARQHQGIRVASKRLARLAADLG